MGREIRVKIDSVTKSYGGNKVLSDFSAEIPDNGVTVITGRSGAGKTTLTRLIAGLEKPDSGSIDRRGRVSVLFQEDRLFPQLTARQNVAAVAGVDNAGKADRLLKEVGLADAADKFPSELSGGMRRRVAIARALAFEAETYIFDEPMKGLDPELKKTAARLIFSETSGKCLIVVTHEPEDFEFCNPVGIHVDGGEQDPAASEPDGEV